MGHIFLNLIRYHIQAGTHQTYSLIGTKNPAYSLHVPAHEYLLETLLSILSLSGTAALTVKVSQGGSRKREILLRVKKKSYSGFSLSPSIGVSMHNRY